MAALTDEHAGVRATDRRGGPPELERYTVESLLGQGGVGSVFRARDRATGEMVALKTLELVTAHAVSLFEREYRTLATLTHPSVARTFDYGISEDGRRYYTMELIEGDDLHTLAPVAWPLLCAHLRQVAEVLALLHGRGLIHRDVSPRNVRIGRDGRVRLLDFGALAPFGGASDIVGTPACIAPEALERKALDGRSDLFSLGATAYFALTGRKPYDITTLASAKAAYEHPVRSLLESSPELPIELDDLVQMLLQIDPSRRPPSAADVIERLGAIGGVGDVSDSEMPAGHFSSPALFGRTRELQELRGHLEASMLGRGAAVVIDGTARLGRTRLARELLLEARLAGTVAVLIEGGGARPGDACCQLLDALVRSAPEEARAVLEAEPQVAALLRRELRAGGEVDVTALSLEASAALQSGIVRTVFALAKPLRLAIIVDDAHLIDAMSAGVFFGVAHRIFSQRMLLALTINSDRPLHPTIERMVQLSARIRLRALSSDAVDALVASIFGQIPHLARFSRWLETVGAGNPAYTLDLMEALVRRRIVKRMSGSWSLPEELPQTLLPASVEDALQAILADLPADALELARLIAVQRSSVPLALCCEMLKPRSEYDVDCLCAALLAERVVTYSPAGYRIAHDGHRNALLTPLAETELARLHRRVGEALLVRARCTGSAADIKALAVSTEVVQGCLQAGWHLLNGGEAERGRELLRTMSPLLMEFGQNFSDAVPALESSLAAYEVGGWSECERINLMAPLTVAGTFLDPRLTYRYGVPLIESAGEVLGIRLASRLGRFLPKRLALYAALLFAAVRMRFTERRMIARDFSEGIRGLLGIATAVLGTYASLSDSGAAARMLARLRPVGWFPPTHPAAITYRFQRALGDLAAGRYAHCVRSAREVLAWMLTPASVDVLSAEPRRLYMVGLHIAIGGIDVYRSDDRVSESIRALELAGTPAALESAAGLRANYHACRGEIREYQIAREALDVLAAQGGSPWRQDVLMPRCMWWIEAQCEDALSLKRTIRQLEALSRRFETLATTYAAAHACYLSDRGLMADAIERYGAQLEAAVRVPTPLTARLIAAYTRVLRQNGQAERARDLCKAALASFSQEELELRSLVHGLELELGRALASTGYLTDAAAHMDALCAAQAGHDNPLLHALSHIGRAEVAVLQAERKAWDEHIAQAEHWAKRTHYGALFGLLHRLHARARAAGVYTQDSAAPLPLDAEIASIQQSIASCHGEAARQQLALDLIIEHAGAAAGFLFLSERNVLRLAAPLHGLEPSDALQSELEERVREWYAEDAETATVEPCAAMNTVVEAGMQDAPSASFDAKIGSAYRIVFLSLHRSEQLHLVGVAALAEGKLPIRAIPGLLLDALALTLYHTGDASLLQAG